MKPVARTLCAAFASAAAELLDLLERRASTRQAETRALVTKLTRLSQLAQPPQRAGFEASVQRSLVRLRQQCHDGAVLGALLVLLQQETPATTAFWRAAVGELILSSCPNIGWLLDIYRREIRGPSVARGEWLPPWQAFGGVIDVFIRQLLPATMARRHALRDCLPDAAELALLDELRAQMARRRLTRPFQETAPLLAPALVSAGAPNGKTGDSDQRIIAHEGGSIAHVQQTIVHGDLYALPAPPQPDIEALHGHYRSFLSETFGSLDFRGVMHVQQVTRLSLERIYIPLTSQSLAPDAAHGGAAPQQEHVVSLHERVRDTPLLVVLGEPGAGKSTLVRYILLALAHGQARERLGLEPIWLPIFFPVAAFAEARSEPGRRNLSPLDYLGEYYRGLSQPDYTPLFRQALMSGRGLVLLDGIDEVRADRLGLVRCLEAFVREWDDPGNRFIATSRIAGYHDAPLDSELFACVTIQPLGDDDIRQFIGRWSRAFEISLAADHDEPEAVSDEEIDRRAALRAHSLTDAVFADANVTALARNPLLLTILALLHNQGARLPDRRVDLYRLCVETLTETWNRTRSLSGREVYVYLGSEQLSERFVVNLLGPVALWAHREQPGGLIDQQELDRQLTRVLMQTDGLAHGPARRLSRSFIELIRCDTGLLQERGYRRYGFMHRTFEEYLAARSLLESVTVDDPDALIHAFAADPHWREVLRLAIAAAPQRETQRLLLHLLDAPAEGERRGRPVVLAGECLLDIGRNGATQRAWTTVIDHLIALMGDDAAAVETRVASGHVLGRLGDPRLLLHSAGGTTLEAPHVDDMARVAEYWRPIAAGRFWYGDDREQAMAVGQRGRRAETLSEVELAWDFQIARYPVTNGEYRRFIDAGGYRQRRWWTPTGWAFLQSGGRLASAEPPGEPLSCPALWDNDEYTGNSQPVVGISWYEAHAYCTWLTHIGHREGWLPGDEVIRLPTSLEWERAARHTDRRRYPWGDAEPTAGHANFTETGLRLPAPVGCFPAGAAACGALDMAGNVWEWTATIWSHIAEARPRRDVAPDERPVIRGGAFNWVADYLMCGSRYWFSPGQRYNLLGFRAVRVHGEGV